MAGYKRAERGQRMARRIVETCWWFDSESLLSLQRVIDRIIKTKQADEKSRAESIRMVTQLQLDYRRRHAEKVTEVEVGNDTNSASQSTEAL